MPPALFCRGALLLALVAAPRAYGAAAAGHALPAPQTQAQPAAVVTVEFRALAGDGTPILDLKPSDVSLKVGGRLREILALEVMQPATAGKPAPGAPEQPPAPFVTNAVAPGVREVILLLDEEGIGAGREKPVIDALGQFVAALSPADRVALVTTRTGVRVHSSARRDRLAAAVTGLTGRATRGENAADAACRTQVNVASLGQVLEGVDRSAPTVVLFVSNGLVSPSPMTSIARGTGTQAAACEVTSADLDDLGAKALAARAHLYAVQVMDDAAPPAGATGAGGRTAGATDAGTDLTAGLEHIAGLTGNSIVRLIGDSGAAMRRIAAETSAYYVAAFEAAAAERHGSRQRVEVSVARPGAVVRVQPAIVIEKPGTGKPSRGTKPKAREIVALSRAFRDLPLRAAAHLSRGAGNGKLSVVVLFEPTDPATSLTEAAVGLFDERGTARTQWAAQSGALKGRPVAAALTAPPAGTYRLRIAAVDASGAAGTIDDEVKVDATQPGAVWVGGLAFGVSANNAFEPRLQFTDEPVAVTVVEVFGAPKNASVETKFEMAGSETGPALATLPGKTQASSDTLRGAFVAFPIAQMPPGDVVVRAVVRVDGQTVAAHPVRTFRKAAR